MSIMPLTGSAQIIMLPARPPRTGFSSLDLVALTGWTACGRRLTIEDSAGDQPDGCGFALIYRGDEPWASWGLSRTGGSVLVWDCITHADIGRFGTVQAALNALPDAGWSGGTREGVQAMAKIVQLRGERRGAAAAP